jgi:hypothetical protein
MGVRCLPKHAAEIAIDLDAMGHLLHGQQEGRHFNTYYGDYCYLPLYGFVRNIPLWAQVRTSDHGVDAGVVPALEKMVAAIRQRCRRARIIVRGDSGFCREVIMAWCESSGVYYCLGLAKNSVLIEQLGPALAGARARHCLTGTSVRVFAEFTYGTRKTWSRPRRIIGKAEVSRLGDSPRFLATNLPARGFPGEDLARFTPARLYEGFYCARGQMENMLKQQTLDLQADRMSTHYLASNQLRLWLATFAYLLMERLRGLGLAGTDLACATAGSVRRVYVQLNTAYPWQEMFRLCQRRLQALGRASG